MPYQHPRELPLLLYSTRVSTILINHSTSCKVQARVTSKQGQETSDEVWQQFSLSVTHECPQSTEVCIQIFPLKAGVMPSKSMKSVGKLPKKVRPRGLSKSQW